MIVCTFRLLQISQWATLAFMASWIKTFWTRRDDTECDEWCISYGGLDQNNTSSNFQDAKRMCALNWVAAVLDKYDPYRMCTDSFIDSL